MVDVNKEQPGDDKDIETIRHSASHIMAEAVLYLFPDAKFGIGPAIENGFYYDFDLPRPLTTDDLPAITDKMNEIISGDLPFSREEVSKAKAQQVFASQSYKLELINEIEDDTVSLYSQGEFIDLCRGPHIPRHRAGY